MNQHTFRRAVEELLAAHKALDAAREHFVRAELTLTDGSDAPFTPDSEIVKSIKRQRLALYGDGVSWSGSDGQFFSVTPTILQLAKFTTDL